MDSAGVPLSILYKWQADLPLTPSTIQQDHQGPPSFIRDIEPQLLLFIYEWRDRGIPVSRFSVVQKAIQLKPEFAEKTMRARMMCVSQFLHKYDLVHRVGTHTSPKPPEAAKDDAKSYLQLVVPKCVGCTRSQDFLMNMDQTNNYLCVSPKSTVNVCGSQIVNMHKGADDSHCCTIAFTVTASGKILPPFVVYKGTRGGGGIHRQDLPKHPQGIVYTVQKKAWFNEEVMLEWVDTVLAPYAAKVPIGIIPILFLDSFKVHMLGTVADAIHKLGVEIKFIPPGCTGLIQLINVGFTKPYKANYTKLYTKFLMNQDANQPLSGEKHNNVF